MSGWRSWLPGYRNQGRDSLSPVRGTNGNSGSESGSFSPARYNDNRDYLSLEGLTQKFLILQEINHKYTPERDIALEKSTESLHRYDSIERLKHTSGTSTSTASPGRADSRALSSDIKYLVDTLRSIAEILIWGDQNDGTVFEYFLEKNIFAHFLNVLYLNFESVQRTDVSIQLLQTLNILFENLKNDTSFYFLLSNNHVNEIIQHDFDFNNEEILAYYISFLKTLSLRLNEHTVHFFFNEHSRNFPLYSAALRFITHQEFMVKIAARTITLNVFRLQYGPTTRYICDHTASDFFKNVVGQMYAIYQRLSERPSSKDEVVNLLEEHQELLHYAADILMTETDELSEMLTSILLSDLVEPHYIQFDENPQVSLVLLAHALHIIPKLSAFILPQLNISQLCDTLVLKFEESAITAMLVLFRLLIETGAVTGKAATTPHKFMNGVHDDSSKNQTVFDANQLVVPESRSMTTSAEETELPVTVNGYGELSPCTISEDMSAEEVTDLDIVDENRTISPSTECEELANSIAVGIERTIFQEAPDLVDRLLAIVEESIKIDSVVRTVTVYQAVQLMKHRSCELSQLHEEMILSYLKDLQSTLRLHFRKDKDNFADIFQQEVHYFTIKHNGIKRATLLRHLDTSSTSSRSKTPSPVAVPTIPQTPDTLALSTQRRRWENLEHLLSEPQILRDPHAKNAQAVGGARESAEKRHVILVYFLLQELLNLGSGREGSVQYKPQQPMDLPDLFKTSHESSVFTSGSKINLDNSDLASCYLNGQRKFMVIREGFVLLVDPDPMKLGWAIIRRILSLARIELKQLDAKSLMIIVNNKNSAGAQKDISERFVFEDHIRCSAVRARLLRGRDLLLRDRQKWLGSIIGLGGADRKGMGNGELGGHDHGTPGRAVKTKQPSRNGQGVDFSGAFTI